MRKFTNNLYDFSQECTTWDTRIMIVNPVQPTYDFREQHLSSCGIVSGSMPEIARDYLIKEIEIQPELNRIWVKIKPLSQE